MTIKRKNDDKDDSKNKKNKSIITFADLLNNMGSNENDDNDDIEIYNDSDNDSDNDSEDLTKEYCEISKEIFTIQDLIDVGKQYDSNKRYNINVKRLNNMIPPLEELHLMVGMESVKSNIVDHIIFYLQKLEEKRNDMIHTVIQGPPGVGKSDLGQILAKLYRAMGVLKTDTYKLVKRSDLIGQYLGHTAQKTQTVLDSCKGGACFIDEAYSLGNPEGRDSFSKECIDTINQFLTENKNTLIIIAGYEDDLKKCFFSYNKGLERRFNIRYTIESYTALELKQIFIKIVLENGWRVSDDLSDQFFEINYNLFKFFGGDMEILFFNSKISHSRRVFCLSGDHKKIITNADITKGLEVFQKNKNKKVVSEVDNKWKTLYT
jgi:SpoVK/Ycf46/Vps4 family AAA+-type ATPase